MPVYNNVQNQKNTPALYTATLANQPAAGFTGRLFVSSDTFALYRDNGTGWDLIGGPGTGTITGSGTAGKLTKFTAAAVIGNSIVSESGTMITVSGSVQVDGNGIVGFGGINQYIQGDSVANNLLLGAGGGANVILFPYNAGKIGQFTSSSTTTGYWEYKDANANLVRGGLGYGSGLLTGAVVSDMVLRSEGAVKIAANGNNLALTINASLNAVFVGTVTGSSIIKNGGLSTQFLKADGSIDSNTYLTAAGAVTSIAGTANQVIASASTGSVTLSLPQSIATNSNVTFANITGNALIKSGGLSTQFLKADGSIDSNTYLTAAGAVTSIAGTANQVIASASTGSVTLSLPQSIATGSSPTFAALTLNGQLTAVNAVLTAASNYLSLKATNATTGYADFYYNTNTLAGYIGSGPGVLSGSANSDFIMRSENAAKIATGGNTLALTITSSQIINTASRLNVNGAPDNANFQLQVNGCTYTNSFSPTASTKTTNWTIGDNTTYIFTGGTGVTATFENPGITNKIVIIKNYSANSLTIASYNGTTNGIVNLTNTVVSSVTLLTGQVAIFQQSGGSHTFQIM